MNYVKKMNVGGQNFLVSQSNRAASKPVVNHFAQAIRSHSEKPMRRYKFSQSITLEQLPHSDQYYLDNYGLDKLAYLAFLKVNEFAHRACHEIEEAEYADPNYNPFFP